MPIFKRDAIELSYEEHGTGFPVSLIALEGDALGGALLGAHTALKIACCRGASIWSGSKPMGWCCATT
jgi:hypothetical protein